MGRLRNLALSGSGRGETKRLGLSDSGRCGETKRFGIV